MIALAMAGASTPKTVFFRAGSNRGCDRTVEVALPLANAEWAQENVLKAHGCPEAYASSALRGEHAADYQRDGSQLTIPPHCTRSADAYRTGIVRGY